MKDKALYFLKKNWITAALFLILMAGSFLRAYHFSDWMHFELDQSRDAKVVDLALDQGIGNLPLLGPKAAGSFLRLGPIFYYFEYISAKIFGSTPPGQIALSLIFSCFTIIVLYYFLKRYFEEKISLLLSFLFAVSVFFVMYSRFGWNPNNLPFFVILSFLALLRFCDPEEKRRGFWMIIFAIALSVTIQLHFLAFVAIPTISAIFLILKRPHIKIRYWIISILIIVIFYLPPILNDIKTGGENIKQFQMMFHKKSEDSHGKIEKMYKNYTEQSLGYFLPISGYEKAEFPRFIQKTRLSYKYLCDSGCKNGIIFGGITFVFFSLGILLLIYKIIKFIPERNSCKKDFLILSGLWFFVSFFLFYPIAYDIAPRFFLLVSALPFVFLGLIFENIQLLLKNKHLGWGIILLFFIPLASYNLQAVQKRFNELKIAPYKSFEISPDRILKERTRVTLSQQYAIIAHMLAIQKQNEWPIYLNSEPFYRRSFLYHINKNGIDYDDFRNLQENIYEHGNYFLIYPTLSNREKRVNKYLDQYNVIQEKNFGTLTLWQLYPKKEFINEMEQTFKPNNKSDSAPGVPVRFRWEEIFNDSNGDEKEIENQ